MIDGFSIGSAVLNSVTGTTAGKLAGMLIEKGKGEVFYHYANHS